MKVIVDTSVWSEALRRRKNVASTIVREFQSLIQEHRVTIIGPIRQEILSGLREDEQFEKLETHTAAFPDVPLETADYVMAAKFFNICRAKGIQGSNTDFVNENHLYSLSACLPAGAGAGRALPCAGES